MDNAANKRFVEDFQADYKREPSPYAAQAYDTVAILDAALKATGGKTDPAVLAPAIKNAKFDSVRGKFRFNTNNFPIQDWYAAEVVKEPSGKISPALREKIFEDRGDAYVQDCKMK
jgi:branched-chain amino acid transport system substrate-binding protein